MQMSHLQFVYNAPIIFLLTKKRNTRKRLLRRFQTPPQLTLQWLSPRKPAPQSQCTWLAHHLTCIPHRNCIAFLQSIVQPWRVIPVINSEPLGELRILEHAKSCFAFSGPSGSVSHFHSEKAGKGLKGSARKMCDPFHQIVLVGWMYDGYCPWWSGRVWKKQTR